MKGIKLREGLLFPILIAFLLFSMVAVISVGSASIDMGTVYRILVDQLFFQGKGTEAGLWEKSFYQIVWNIRLPRVLFGVCCGAGLCIASCTQQLTLLHTTVGKAGFMTACYILVVPLIGLLFGRRCGVKHWCGVALAMAGLYFLCMTGGSFGFAMGDLIGLSCALLFSIHITVIDHFSPMVDGVKMSCIQFFFCAILSGIGMLIFEQPSFVNILAAWKPILYAGAMSSGVGYTLQIVGQKGMNPAVASLIMSLESVISVIAGWLILGQALSGREIFGCVLMFGAIVLAQLPERKKQSV